MLKRIFLVTIAFTCNTKFAEAVDIGNGGSFDMSYLVDKKQL